MALNIFIILNYVLTMDEKHECETIYRLAILAFETYITSSAVSLCKENENPQQFYDLSSEIILISALANYLTSTTKNYDTIFEKYFLEINNYPLYNGIKILNNERDLLQIGKILKSWRNQIVYIQYPSPD